jgi:hypothetical protein
VVTAYNTWEAHLRAAYERRRSMRATLSSWMGGTRCAFNTWRRQHEALSPAKVVAARWLNATMFAFFRRWSTDYQVRGRVSVSVRVGLALGLGGLAFDYL